MRDDVEFNVQFCNLIENHPVLYDYNRADYCNRNVQDQAWSIIARTLNETVADCKSRWANIRNRYAKYNKSKCLSSGSSAKVVREYYLAQHLIFLDGYLKSRPSKSNLPTNPVQRDDIDAGDELMSPYRPPSLSPSPRSERHPSPLSVSSSKKSTTVSLKEVNQSAYDYFISKRLRGDNEKKSEPFDTDLYFLQSMLPEMKAMNMAQKRKFKMGVMQLATKILDESEATFTCTSTPNTATFACISQCNTVPYYAPSPPRQQTFGNDATPQQTIQNVASPPVIQQTIENNPPAAPQHAYQNIATPPSPRNIASPLVYQQFEDSQQDESNRTYFNLSPYLVISVSSTQNMPLSKNFDNL